MAIDDRPKVEVLVIQCGPAEPEPEKNVAANLKALRDATASRKPDFVVFTELSTTQYFCGYNDPKWFDVAEPLDGPSVKAFREEAKRLGCYILLTFYERGAVKGEFFNSLAVIGPMASLSPARCRTAARCAAIARTTSRISTATRQASTSAIISRPVQDFPYSTPRMAASAA